jgi:hypothetical protein
MLAKSLRKSHPTIIIRKGDSYLAWTGNSVIKVVDRDHWSHTATATSTGNIICRSASGTSIFNKYGALTVSFTELIHYDVIEFSPNCILFHRGAFGRIFECDLLTRNLKALHTYDRLNHFVGANIQVESNGNVKDSLFRGTSC